LTLILSSEEQNILSGARGDGAAMALRIVADTARLMSAPSLIPVQSAHIDGALYHGDSGTLFAERLVELGAKAAMRATLNVGGLDLMGCSKVNLPPHEREMAGRMMRAYIALGCEPTWTCAPYQAGHRPALGTDVAWGESNAVVFCNSVLGARSNRYGDFLDIACAISGRAPNYGLHLRENRRAEFALDVSALPPALLTSEIAFPVLGSLFGRLAGTSVGVVIGITGHPGEDALKAFGAAAASTGGVGLFHILGVTPEAPDMDTATGGAPLRETIHVTAKMFTDTKRRLATAGSATQIDAVAIGSPHLSAAEFDRLAALLGGRRLSIPFFACTGRHALKEIETNGIRTRLEAAGVTIVADTCVVVTPILKDMAGGVLMTNSGKFAQYAPGNTGYGIVFGSMAECVESAVTGRPEYA
jgi:predicted aconitase